MSELELTRERGIYKYFNKSNLFSLILMSVAAVLIVVTAIIFEAEPLNVLPLMVSLVVGLLQAGANRYANLVGGINAIVYAIVYFSFGLYGMAFQALLVSSPFQLVTFVRWSKNKYKSSTKFRRLSKKQLIIVICAVAVAFVLLYLALTAANSSYRFLDNAITIAGLLSSTLTLLSFIEYSWLAPILCVLDWSLGLSMALDDPSRITYLIYSTYSFICIVRQFFSVMRIYKEQKALEADECRSDDLPPDAAMEKMIASSSTGTTADNAQ
ncbi:MAG: nicotinamide mononucleotide transporter [Clostridia bacterium]|nr:nicotinamide mononucleotide transporter [Clostridia bacterium]